MGAEVDPCKQWLDYKSPQCR